jgi:hypothetical protein
MNESRRRRRRRRERRKMNYSSGLMPRPSYHDE